MKKIKLLFCIVLFSFSFCEGQQWLWGIQGNKPGDSWGICVDTAHNCYLTGETGGAITFGSVTISSGSGAFVIKVDQNGNAIWGAQAVTKNLNYAFGYSVTTDLKEDVYETGMFEDTASFGTNTLIGLYYNLFLVKYNKNGNVLWARQSKTPSIYSSLYPSNVFSEGNGNVYVTGYFIDTAIFGTDTLISGGIQQTGFLVKYDLNGNILWAKQPVSTNSQTLGYWVTADAMGNEYVLYSCGSQPIIFGNDTVQTTNTGMNLVKYDSNGNVLWVRQPTTGFAMGNSIVTDHTGNIYLIGSFRDSLDFGQYHLYTKSPYTNIFLAKYDKNGNVLWAEQSEGLDSTFGWSGVYVAAGNSNDVYIYGNDALPNNDTFYKVKFGSDTLSLIPPAHAIYYPAVLFKLDTNGNTLCGSIIHDGGEDDIGMAADPSGKFVYVGGDLMDTDIFGSDILPAIQGENPFIARWLPCGYTTDGINEVKGKNEQLKVFPNPFTSSTNISIDNGQLTMDNYLELYDVTGQKLKTIEFKGNTYTLSAEGLAKGMYFIRVLDREKNVVGTSKIVVQ